MIDFDRIVQSLEKEPAEDKQFAQLLDFIIQKLFPGGEYRLSYDPQWGQCELDIRHEGKFYGLRVRDEQVLIIRTLKRMIERYNIKR
ncbi:hypothetical protein SEA_PSONYX_39 [Corynebacterium phage PSonyx]|nr:hypothetical protein SEA_PSONYX_39 [Corynebacterium phage PSonyx]